MNIVPFSFHAHEVRSILIDGEPWFVAHDVCGILEYRNGPEAIRDHVEPEDKQSFALGLPGRAPTLINEAGLYSLVIASKKPQARAFKRWVVGEVLPAIHRTGGYCHSGNDAAQMALRRVLEVADRRVERETQNEFLTFGNARSQERVTAVTAQVAQSMGLDVAAVERCRGANVDTAMAELYGDRIALERITREKARIAAEVSRRIAARPKARKRPAVR